LGCASAPVSLGSSTEGEWSAKMLIKDLKENQSHILNAEIKAIQPGHLRMDVMTTLGIHVFSLALNNENMTYLVVREKKYYTGPLSSRAMASILKINLDPRILFSLLFNQIPKDTTYACVSDDQGLPKVCEDKKTRIKISWLEKDSEKQIINIHHDRASIQLSLKLLKTKVASEEGLFEMTPPAGFVPLRTQN
jgi:hypothetical protein